MSMSETGCGFYRSELKTGMDFRVLGYISHSNTNYLSSKVKVTVLNN